MRLKQRKELLWQRQKLELLLLEANTRQQMFGDEFDASRFIPELQERLTGVRQQISTMRKRKSNAAG